MYAIAGVGLWLLWRSRKAGSDRSLLAHLSIGFGLWHVFDGVLSHWVLGIHRIRMDVESPLFWDVLWLILFGFLPFTFGWMLRCKDGSGHRVGLTLPGLTIGIIGAGLWAASPAPSSSMVVVLFSPGTSEGDAFAAMQALDGRLVWTDASRQLWAIDMPNGRNANRFYLHGGIWVSSTLVPLVCITWSKA